jgi:hypothetical protein
LPQTLEFDRNLVSQRHPIRTLMVISVYDGMGGCPPALRAHMKRMMIEIALHSKIALGYPFRFQTHIILLLSIFKSAYDVNKNVAVELVHEEKLF